MLPRGHAVAPIHTSLVMTNLLHTAMRIFTSPYTLVFALLLTTHVLPTARSLNATVQYVHLNVESPLIRAIKNKTTRNHPTYIPKPKGYTFDPCSYNRHCISPRACLLANFTGPCRGSSGCLCLQEYTQICETCEECEKYPEESCLQDPTAPPSQNGICGSTFTAFEAILKELGCTTYPGITPPVTEDDIGDQSENQAFPAFPDGRKPRDKIPQLLPSIQPFTTTPVPSTTVHQLPLLPSRHTPSVVEIEQRPTPTEQKPTPTKQKKARPSSRPSRLSPSVSLTPLPSVFKPSDVPVPSVIWSYQTAEEANIDNGAVQDVSSSQLASVCVDARALAHLPRSSLIYVKHQHAHVLCDLNGSCATPGHIVVYNTHVIMMREYCRTHSKCSSRVILVNSPRFEKGLRIPSLTKDLEFTAFAARFETRVEEHAFRFAIRRGL